MVVSMQQESETLQTLNDTKKMQKWHKNVVLVVLLLVTGRGKGGKSEK
jgi:hypothetical protein